MPTRHRSPVNCIDSNATASTPLLYGHHPSDGRLRGQQLGLRRTVRRSKNSPPERWQAVDEMGWLTGLDRLFGFDFLLGFGRRRCRYRLDADLELDLITEY